MKPTTDGFWAVRRMQYRKAKELCESVDEVMSQMIFVTFANNLFFVCVQIVRSIKWAIEF